MSGQSLVTYVGVAHPWMCDVMGHMNVRHYAAMFDDASFQLLGHIAGAEGLADTSRGWADVRSEVEYKHETRAGALLTIHSRVIKAGRSSVTFEQVMSGSLDGVVHAVNRTVSVRFDLIERTAVALDAGMLARVETLQAGAAANENSAG
ncbi:MULTISPECIES: acyl-CoA thioesterase [Rhizobium/Agrobacterium group]|uniref:acyl-CoA thioesterase n=1 Tax=Rhizobium/Agrobacterium group TaxID=227290 RepID=UPI000714BF47|nr:acyl-CoA thioesterase [Rhizobium sp. Root483D2]KQY43647.1 4-hydroxybenzoyl-CoA thioesterase [Rhizobium sp. Root483D2]